MAVTDILQLGSDISSHTWRFSLFPKAWEEYPGPTDLGWQAHRLISAERGNVPEQPGIYTLVVQPSIAGHPICSYLMYVGQTDSLRRRFGEYLTKEKKRPLIVRLLRQCPNHLLFCFTPLPLDRLDATEAALQEAYIPPCNDRLPGEIGRARKAFQ